MLAGEAPARGSADLHRLESIAGHLAAPIGNAAANIEYHLSQRGPERHFHQPGVGHMAGQRKGLGARRSRRAQLPELLGAFVDDADGVCERLHVVDNGRLAPQAALGRERRLGPRHAALPLDRGNHRGLLTAHKSSRAFHHLAAQRLA